ncbi:WD40 repeat-like protein [Neoconidiobolus thromboides FSU 785]|nr:WD40 repeat-like protein [Neoconidiobolus thromboides FSU 785]
MDLSNYYPQQRGQVKLSNSYSYLCYANGDKIIIRNPLEMELIRQIECGGEIESLDLSIDNELVLAVIKDSNRIEIYNIENEGWRAIIEDQCLGVKTALFSVNPRYCFVYSEVRLRISIWSLCDKKVKYINCPKFYNKGISYRNDDLYMALLERKDGKDYLGIYNTVTWSLRKHFQLETIDAANISWSQDGQFIAVWDSIVTYKLFIYSPAGFLITKYSAYSHGLGLKTVDWSPSGQFIMLASYDEKIRLLNTYTWQPTFELEHSKKLSSKTEIYKENQTSTWKKPVLNPTIDIKKSQPNKDLYYAINLKMGVGICVFNPTGRYFVSRNDAMPTSLFIWKTGTPVPIFYSEQVKEIKMVQWNPIDTELLAFISEGNHLYLWSPKLGFQCYTLNKIVQITSITWSENGFCLIVTSLDKFCLAFPIIPADEDDKENNKNVK